MSPVIRHAWSSVDFCCSPEGSGLKVGPRSGKVYGHWCSLFSQATACSPLCTQGRHHSIPFLPLINPPKSHITKQENLCSAPWVDWTHETTLNVYSYYYSNHKAWQEEVDRLRGHSEPPSHGITLVLCGCWCWIVIIDFLTIHHFLVFVLDFLRDFIPMLNSI